MLIGPWLSLIADSKPASLNPWQIGILCLQVLIALGNLIVARKWCLGAADRAEASLAAQQQDVSLKVRADNERTAAKLHDACDKITSAAMKGTESPDSLAAAHEVLAASGKDFEELKTSVRGLEYSAELLQSITLFENQIGEYCSSKDHAERVRLSAAMEGTAKNILDIWQSSGDARLKRLMRS